MKKTALALSLLSLVFIICIGAPLLAQVDEEIAPPEQPIPGPPAVKSPAPPPQASWGGRWPWTSQRLVQPQELMSLSLRELEVMRNEIYARHGWIFRRPDLRSYFESQPWYRPRSDNAYYSNQQVEAELNPIERKNIQIITSREKALGR